jgi:hypothetical protein
MLDETGDSAILERGSQLDEQITDFVDAIFQISPIQTPQTDDFYIDLIAIADHDPQAKQRIIQNLLRDFNMAEKAYLYLAESIQEGVLDLIDILQNPVLLAMSTQKRSERCGALVPLVKIKGTFAGSLIDREGVTYAKLGSINGVELLANCQEVELLAFLEPDTDLELDDPQIQIANYPNGQFITRLLSNGQTIGLEVNR